MMTTLTQVLYVLAFSTEKLKIIKSSGIDYSYIKSSNSSVTSCYALILGNAVYATLVKTGKKFI